MNPLSFFSQTSQSCIVSRLTERPHPLIYILIIPQVWGFVKGFFHFFEEILFYLHQVTRLREVVFFLPLAIIIIPENSENARWNIAQKLKDEMNFFCAFCQPPGRISAS